MNCRVAGANALRTSLNSLAVFPLRGLHSNLEINDDRQLR